MYGYISLDVGRHQSFAAQSWYGNFDLQATSISNGHPRMKYGFVQMNTIQLDPWNLLKKTDFTGMMMSQSRYQTNLPACNQDFKLLHTSAPVETLQILRLSCSWLQILGDITLSCGLQYLVRSCIHCLSTVGKRKYPLHLEQQYNVRCQTISSSSNILALDLMILEISTSLWLAVISKNSFGSLYFQVHLPKTLP